MREANVSGMPSEYGNHAMESEPPQPAAERNPPGFWKTTALGVAVLLVSQFLGAGALFFHGSPGASASHSEYFAFMSTATTLSSIGGMLLALIVVFRAGAARFGILPLPRSATKQVILWIAGALCLAVAADLVKMLLGGTSASEFVLDMYAASTTPLLLIFAIVVAAPVFEEVLFRGLLFAGWSRSRLGATGTILLTTVLWTGIHLQYGAYELGQVFAIGILLGFARYRTGSLLVPIAMHVALNLAATAQMIYMLQSQ